MKRYLTSQGLQTLWNQIKALFATKSELNQKASKTELNTLSESVSASLSEIEQTDIRQDASISSLSENKADKTALNKLSTDTTAALDKKVDKVSGMGLSHNDYTDEDKAKLNGIADGAEVNTIVAIQRNGTAITPANRVVNILVPVKTSELNNDSTYQTAADVAETIVGVKLDLASGIITLTRKNGTTFTLDLPTEKIIKSGYYDSKTKEIVLVLEDESEIRFSASELIDEYYADESTLELYTDTNDGNKKKFRIKTAYKNKIDGSEQTTNKTASVSSSSTETQYPTAKAVYNAVKDLATKVQTFTTASTRANIESGETISTIFGKIRKWLVDLKAVAFSGSYNDLTDKPTIGNGKVTIKQKGVEKGSFSMNQTGNATIELTDENTTYGIATSATAGLVKSGGDITVASDGEVSVNDNSHNHTIANVTGLQSALNEKLSTTGLANYARRLSPVVNQRNGTTTRYLEICRATVGRNINYVIYDASFIINGGETTSTISMQARIMGWKGSNYQLDEIILRVEQCSDGLAINRLCAEYVHPTANEDGWIVVYMDTETKRYWNYSIIPLGSPYDRFKFVQSNQVHLTQGVASLPANGGTVIKGSLKAMATHDGDGNNIVNTYATVAALNNVFSNKYAAWQNSANSTAMWVNVGHIRLNGQSARYITTTFIAIQEYAGLENYAEFKVGAYWDGTKYSNLHLYFLQLNGFDPEEFKLVAINYELMLYAKTSVQYASRTLTITNDYQRPSMWTLNTWTTITQSNLPGGVHSTNEIVSTAFRKLSGCLELTDSNLATYFNSSTGVLTIPSGVTTILFNTTSTKKVFNIVGTCAVNGYRLTIAGQWLPVQKTLSSTTGCFSSYIYGYRAGALGTSFDGATNRLTEAFEDFIYFNGVWYSKAY